MGTALLLGSCDLGADNPDTIMYVRVTLRQANGFTGMLASILKQQGFDTLVAKTADPAPAINHVLEAKSLNVRVRAQNAVLDPATGKVCGYDPPFSAVEQTQYVVVVNRRHPLAQRQASQSFVSIRKALIERGYAVASSQMPCLPLAKLNAA